MSKFLNGNIDTGRSRVCLSLVLLAAGLVSVSGCFGYNQLGVHLFSLKVEVWGANKSPLVGAIVSCSSGETVTVDTSGIALLKFSNIGPYHITVRYQDNIVASYNISMPSDGGKTLTANYAPSGAQSVGEATVSSGSNAFAVMGARLYPILFQYVFNAYGYSIDLASYTPGQFTEWQISSEGEKQYGTRKAFLTRLANGSEWWQVEFTTSDKDSMLMEVLFSGKLESVRRMRQRFGNEAPREVPVTEGWYSSPMKLTTESIEGAVVKKGVSVTVPAGTFECDQLEFGVAPGMTLRLFHTSDVPGGVVKYEMVSEKKDLYSADLKAYGTGAVTMLNSY